MFHTIYCTDDIFDMDTSAMNKLELQTPSYWNAFAILYAARKYILNHDHPYKKEITDVVELADKTDMEDLSTYAKVVINFMASDDDGKKYMNKIYEKALKADPSAWSNLIEQAKFEGAMHMMADGFLDKWMTENKIKPTEYTEAHRNEEGELVGSKAFLVDGVDCLIDKARVHVEEGDTFTLGRESPTALYLTMKVTNSEGVETTHMFVPVKWASLL